VKGEAKKSALLCPSSGTGYSMNAAKMFQKQRCLLLVKDDIAISLKQWSSIISSHVPINMYFVKKNLLCHFYACECISRIHFRRIYSMLQELLWWTRTPNSTGAPICNPYATSHPQIIQLFSDNIII
jgi:hypothetical protein